MAGEQVGTCALKGLDHGDLAGGPAALDQTADQGAGHLAATNKCDGICHGGQSNWRSLGARPLGRTGLAHRMFPLLHLRLRLRRADAWLKAPLGLPQIRKCRGIGVQAR